MPSSPRLGNGTRMISQRQIMGEAAKTAVYMRQALVAGVAALGENAHEFTQALYKSLGAGVLPRRYPLEANRQLAMGAQRAIEEGWHSRLPVRAPGYRMGLDPNHDRLSGALGLALANPEMTKGTTDRAIAFINNTLLNQEARHWYRVNYGAYGPKASPRRPKAFPVTVDGHALFVLRDEAEPAPNSWLPRGYRTEGKSWFAPTPLHGENKADVVGGGHRAALFTDLGYQHVATNLDPVYDNMFRRYIKEQGTTKIEATGIVVNMSGGRATVKPSHYRAG